VREALERYLDGARALVGREQAERLGALEHAFSFSGSSSAALPSLDCEASTAIR
jgi:hypothetical protein